MAKKDAEVIELKTIVPQRATITIVGDSDLICNQMNKPTRESLINARKDKAKDVSEEDRTWEKIITSVHWLGGDPEEFTEETLKEKLENDHPCITCFGLKASFKQSVTRNRISTYSTEFDASVSVFGKGDGLVPFNFTEHHVDEKLMSPKRGAPVLIYLNRFSGWSAEFDISYLETTYSLEQIINVINLAGFGIGIGSGRTSGYGRYHVENVK